MMKNTVYVFWTGGWDSTWRILQLAVSKIADNNKVIQPVYVTGDNRKSERLEIEAMEKILSVIRERTQITINNILLIAKKDIPPDSQITEAYERIRKSVRIGTQYEWLARLAVLYPGIELGIEKPNGEYSGCITAIEKNGCFIKRDDSFYVDTEKSSDDCCMVFGNFSFPIIDITETDMIRLTREWKCEDIMKCIWFCHEPVQGKPCGVCRPCQQKMECGMEWLLPEQSQKNYYFYTNIRNLFGEKVAGICKKVLKYLT